MKEIINLFKNPIILYSCIGISILGILFCVFNYKLIIKIYKKYEEIINYLIMGVLATIVSLVSYALLRIILNYNLATFISWIIVVLFAYFTNKIYVFKSKTKGRKLLIECLQFFKYRLASLFIDLGCMWLFVEVFSMNDMLAKLINQIIIIIINYVFSKLFIFKK